MLGLKNLSIAGRGGSSTWWDKMWSSYTQLNPGVYSEAIATEFKRRMKPDYTENLVPNGGGLNATKFIDTNLDGQADWWGSAPGADYVSVLSLVTWGGITIAQRASKGTGVNVSLTSYGGAYEINKRYTLTFKYKSSASISLQVGGFGVKDESNATVSFPANTGDELQAAVIFHPTSTTKNYVWWAIFGAGGGDYIEISEVTITPTVSQNYFNTFGPSGLNKTTADWIYLLTTSGNIVSRTITKSGNLLKWNLDGIIVTQNTLPAYTKGTNAGIITMTSTDGWSGVTALAINTNSFNGVQPNFNTQNVTSFNTSANLLTGRAGSLYAANKMSSANISGNLWTTAMVDAELAYYNTMFAATPPIKNLTLNLSGATMGIPTGAGSNTDLLGILAKFTAAGFTATIIVRTS